MNMIISYYSLLSFMIINIIMHNDNDGIIIIIGIIIVRGLSPLMEREPGPGLGQDWRRS